MYFLVVSKPSITVGFLSLIINRVLNKSALPISTSERSLLLGVGLLLTILTADFIPLLGIMSENLSDYLLFCYLSLFLEFLPLFGVGGIEYCCLLFDILPGDFRTPEFVGMKYFAALIFLLLIRGSEFVEVRAPITLFDDDNCDETLKWLIYVPAVSSNIL